MPSPPPGISCSYPSGIGFDRSFANLGTTQAPCSWGRRGVSPIRRLAYSSVSADVRCVRIGQRMVWINGPRRGEPLCAVVDCISFRKVENAANTTCALGSESTTGTASSHNALGCVAGVLETGHHCFKTADDHRHLVSLVHVLPARWFG